MGEANLHCHLQLLLALLLVKQVISSVFCVFVLCIRFVYSFCVFVLCIRFVYLFCVFVLCIRFVYSFCVFVLCICFVYLFCVFVLCIRFVYLFCVFVLCIRFVYSFCVFVSCIRFVYSFCVFVLCIRSVYSFCLAAFTCHEHGSPALVYAPHHQILISAGRKGEICLFDMRQRQLRHTFQAHDGPIKCLAIDPEEDYFVSGSAEGDIKVL